MSKPMTDAQRAAKRERDRKYRERRRSGVQQTKPDKVRAKNLKLNVKLRNGKSKPKPAPDLERRVAIASIALRALSAFLSMP